MRKTSKTWLLVSVILLIMMLVTPTALAQDPKGAPTPVRFATFNASLNRFNAGDLARSCLRLAAPGQGRQT